MARRLVSAVFVALVAVLCVTAFAQGNAGRWKDDGNGGCVFDATDDGPDQCSPTPGRWKLDGNGGCFFDVTDSGPNQCPPQTSTESEVTPVETPVSSDDAGRRAAEQNPDIAAKR